MHIHMHLNSAPSSFRLVHSHYPQMYQRRQKLRVESSEAANKSRQQIEVYV